MNILKELPAISWQVDEPTYRADPALSYSTLSKYEREGFNNLNKLFEQVSTPSLTFGSAVDAILTGGEEEFNSRFQVMDINISDSGMEICKKLSEFYKPSEESLFNGTPVDTVPDFNSLSPELVSHVAKETGFWKADKWDKIRYREVLKTGDVQKYFYTLTHSDKTVLNTETFNKVMACVKALRESPSTHAYFADNDAFSSVRRYYQLKFKARLKEVDYRCMADLIIVDYDKKNIIPCDLKTSGHKEWDFQDSFCQWNYMIQARLYWLIIKVNLLKDNYFKDFDLKDYRFIVINKDSLMPLVWEFPLTKASGNLIDDEGRVYRDPLEIGTELRHYLDLKPLVPEGIDIKGLNTISCLHKQF